MKKILLLLTLLLVTITANLLAQVTSQAAALDNTFGNGGTVTTKIGTGNNQIWGMALQNDWSIVVGGFAWNGQKMDFAAARYKQNGTLDSTFGINGKVMTAVGDSNDLAFALTLQPDGKILLGGFSHVANKGADFAVVRYNTNGSLDSTFGSNGIVTVPIGTGDDKAYCMGLKQDDWSIVLGGVSFDGANNNFALAKLTINGTLDASFGNNGTVTTPVGLGTSSVRAMALQSDWSIVLGGASFNGTNNTFSLVRFDSTGSLDHAFNKTGKIITPVGSGDAAIYGIAIQPDGNILATGNASNGTFGEFAAVRYTTAGVPDSTFGGTGIATTYSADSADAMYAVTVQSDGKIVTAGSSYNAGIDNCALLRYNPNGTLDQNFGAAGKIVTAITPFNNENYAVAIQPDGKIVTSGYASDSTHDNFALARYLPSLALGVINFVKDENSILIHPNPVEQKATLEYTLQNSEQISIKLIDMQGKTVKYFVTNEFETAGDYKQPLEFTSDLASGSYVIAIQSPSGTVSIKIVK